MYHWYYCPLIMKWLWRVPGHYITPAYDLGENKTAEVTSSTLLPSTDCTVSHCVVTCQSNNETHSLFHMHWCTLFLQVRFYHYSHRENSTSARLVIILRTLRNGDDDRILWDKTVTQSFLWHKAEVTFSTSVKSKVRDFNNNTFTVYELFTSLHALNKLL